MVLTEPRSHHRHRYCPPLVTFFYPGQPSLNTWRNAQIPPVFHASHESCPGQAPPYAIELIFTFFTALPVELQLRTSECAGPDPSVTAIRAMNNTGVDETRVIYKVPALLQTCNRVVQKLVFAELVRVSVAIQDCQQLLSTNFFLTHMLIFS